MDILKFEDRYIPEVVSLWNDHLSRQTQYKPLTGAEFEARFLKDPNFSYDGTFIAVEGGKVIGFANGIVKREFLPGENHENTPGYLTMVVVDTDFRGKGCGSALLQKLEEYFRARGKKNSQSIFFNPIKLEWYIPGTGGHDHNNAPGVDADTPAPAFMERNGYRVLSREVSYHLDLSDFRMSDGALQKQKALSEKGIFTGYYDPRKHFGFDELFDDLGSGDWRKGIMDNLALARPDPVIIAADHGKICGFTGPIRVQESGRGFFVGIGTHSQYRGEGIMSVLFELLMDGFKNAGAKFSTLFTGIDNPARKTYERTGFTIVRNWTVMGKEI